MGKLTLRNSLGIIGRSWDLSVGYIRAKPPPQSSWGSSCFLFEMNKKLIVQISAAYPDQSSWLSGSTVSLSFPLTVNLSTAVKRLGWAERVESMVEKDLWLISKYCKWCSVVSGWEDMTAAKHCHLVGLGSVRVSEFKEVFVTTCCWCYSLNKLELRWAEKEKRGGERVDLSPAGNCPWHGQSGQTKKVRREDISDT